MEFQMIASPIIMKDGKILMVKRVKEPYPGYWSLPGGKVNLGEEPIDAVVREVKEETDLDFENPEFLGDYEFFYSHLNAQFFYVAFKGEVKGSIEEIDKRIKLNEEASEYKWVSKEELTQLKMTKGAEMITQDCF